MRLIERYLFRQLLGPTLAAVGALTAVAVLSEALSSIGVLVNDRQSALVFAKIILLAMPQLIVLILPIAVLIAGLMALNRLHTENELVICFAGGLSRWRVISPALRLACLMTLASMILTFWVQPLSYRALRDTLQAVRTDVFSAMIRPGAFTHPAPGLTVYAQSVGDDGVIHNLFIDHQTNGGRDTAISAREGRLTVRNGAPIILMRRGFNQEFSSTGVFNFLSFDEYALDLTPMMGQSRTVRYKLSDRYLHELFFPDQRNDWDSANSAAMLAEGHARIASPFYNIAFMSLALAGILGGGFSRMGYGTRMASVAGAALIIRVVGLAVQGLASHTPQLNCLQYAAPLVAIAGSAIPLFGREIWARHQGGAGRRAATSLGLAT
jgi:lipopolysaccharide export system permease protein